jgi:hypothetical protein
MYGSFMNRLPLGQSIIDALNPIRFFAALTLPVFIPVFGIRLLWVCTLASSLIFLLWQRCSWWLILILLVEATLLGFEIINVWRTP